MKSNSTIDDVAGLPVSRASPCRGCSTTDANVRPETRERVRRAVEALGYSVNQQARALASGMARQIMLIHAHSPELEPNSYYNSGLELGALRGCSSLGFDLVTRAVDPQDENRVRMLASIIERERPAGLILSPPLSDDIDFIAAAHDAGVQVVAVSAGERTHGQRCWLWGSTNAPAGMRSRGTSRRWAIVASGSSRVHQSTAPQRLRYDGICRGAAGGRDRR